MRSQLMSCVYVDRKQAAATSQDGSSGGGVAALIKQRMLDMAAGKLPHARPVLLFPEGTTTNGRYMLPFRTGAFLAGVPVLPVVLRYGAVSGCVMPPCWHADTKGVLPRADAGGRLPGLYVEFGWRSDVRCCRHVVRHRPPTKPCLSQLAELLLPVVGDDLSAAPHPAAAVQPGALGSLLRAAAVRAQPRGARRPKAVCGQRSAADGACARGSGKAA